MLKNSGKFSAISLALALSGCASTGITVDLNWKVPSIEAGGLVPGEGDITPFTSAAVENHACLSIEDLAELREALRRGNIGEARIRSAAMAVDPQNAEKHVRATVGAFKTADYELEQVIFRILREKSN